MKLCSVSMIRLNKRVNKFARFTFLHGIMCEREKVLEAAEVAGGPAFLVPTQNPNLL